MNIFVFSAAKDKITKYKITDPFLTYFIYMHESLIDWNKVNKENPKQDIEKQIISTFIPQLFQRIDRKTQSNKNNYLKDINVINEIQKAGALYGGGNINQQIIDCKKLYQEQGYEAAKHLRLKQINEAKEKRFHEWWNWLTSENTLKQNPSLNYVLLKMAFDGSKEKEKDPTFRINTKAIKLIEDQIRNSQGQPFNITAAYQDTLNKINAENIEIDQNNPENGWLRLKSKLNDPDGYDENLQKLIDYSTPNGWCTAAGYGVDYLAKGDFWLYLVNNNAKVAIRFSENQVAEIRGQRNEPPFEYFEQVLDFIEKKDFNISSKLPTYVSLLEAKNTNIKFETRQAEDLIPSFEKYIQLTQANKSRISKDQLNHIIKQSTETAEESYRVAQYFDFDETKIGNPLIVESITRDKNSNDSQSQESTWWTFPPWKWVMSVRFNLNKIPQKVIECIAHNNFTSLEFAKWKGYNKEVIPQPIINKIAEDENKSFQYASEALYQINIIPDEIIDSIAKDTDLFIKFATNAKLDLSSREDKYINIILNNSDLCALACKGYGYSKDNIPPPIWNKMIKSPNACILFAEGVDFDQAKIPKEIIDVILSSPIHDACMEYAEKTGYDSSKIPPTIIDKIATDIHSSRSFIHQAGYDFSRIPDIIVNKVAEDIGSSFEICENLQYDSKRIPIKFINTVAQDPEMSARFSKDPEYNIEKLSKTIVNSVASSLDHSFDFAKNRFFKTSEIPTEIMESFCQNTNFALTYAISVISQWAALKYQQKRTSDFIAEREIHPFAIKSIATQPRTAFEFAKNLGFDLMKIPSIIIESISEWPLTSIWLAERFNFEYTKITPKMLESISGDYKASALFIQGVNFDKNRINPKMLESVTTAFKQGKRDFEPKDIFKRLLEFNQFDLTLFDKEIANNLVEAIVSDPQMCLNFVRAKNADINQIPAPIINAISSDPFTSLGYAQIAKYNPKKIPISILNSIAREPDYAFSYAQGCNFNFYIMPKVIMQGVKSKPELLSILRNKYAEFQKKEMANEEPEKSIQEIQTEPSKTQPQNINKNPYIRKPQTEPKEEGLANSNIKITKIASRDIYMNNAKITKIAKAEFPTADTLSLCVLTLKVYLEDNKDNKDNKDIPEDYRMLIEKLPPPRQIRQDFSIKECEVLYETVEYLWGKITGQKIISEETIRKAPEKMCGNYLLLANGILLKGLNTQDIIRKNSSLICSLLDISGLALQEYLSGNPEKLVWFIIKSGAVRLFITKDKRFYGQTSPLTYGKWARKKIQKYDFPKKVVKILDLNAPYEGWKSGIVVIL